MVKKTNNSINTLERISVQFTAWIGTPQSIIIHSIIFLMLTYLVVSGVNFEKVMLIWNTSVSLEAIYLALFIQLSVNRNTQSLEAVEDDIEDIQEDVEGISEDIEEDDVIDAKTKASLEHIQRGLQGLSKELEALKKVKS